MQVPKRGAKIIEPRDFWIPHNSLKKTTSDSAVSNYLRAPIATALVPGMVNRHPSCWMWLHRTRDGIHRTKLNPWMVEKVKTNQARSRLYQSQMLQLNTRWKALAEIYTMHSFAPFFKLKISAKNRQHFFAIE